MNYSDILPLIGSGINVTVALAFLFAFFNGKLHSDAELKRVLDDLKTERDAHEKTRIALDIANTRAEVGVIAAQAVARGLGYPGIPSQYEQQLFRPQNPPTKEGGEQ